MTVCSSGIIITLAGRMSSRSNAYVTGGPIAQNDVLIHIRKKNNRANEAPVVMKKPWIIIPVLCGSNSSPPKETNVRERSTKLSDSQKATWFC